MARRDRFLDDLLTVASQLPWQAGVGLAAVSFLVLHFVAAAFGVAPAATNLADMGSVVGHQVVHVFAFLFQFILPPVFLFGAVASFIKRVKRGHLLDAAATDPRGAVSAMGWRDFEALVGESFRRDGYQVDERGGSAPDGGIDFVILKGGERYLVQCKHWKTQQIGVTVIRELNGVIAAHGAHGGIVVTGGGFTRDAREFADRCKIRLIGGEELVRLIGSGSPIVTSPPQCPECGAEMVERIAKQGKFAGKAFWGCRQYPKCRGILATA
jgi:restriction system protein